MKKFKDFLLLIFIFLLAYISFTYSLKPFPTTDSLPNNLTALNIIFNKRIDLTNYENILIKKDLIGITKKNKNNKIYSKSPVINGILSVPIFFLITKISNFPRLNEKQILNSNISRYVEYIGKINASFLISISAVFLFLLLNKLFKNKKISFIGILTYIFCTAVFNTASQANWQHSFSLFFIIISLYIYFTTKRWGVFFSGLFLGLATQIRITNFFYIIFLILNLFQESENHGFYPWMKRYNCSPPKAGHKAKQKTTGFARGFLFFSNLPKKNKLVIINFCLLLIGFLISYFSIYELNKTLNIPYGYYDEILFSIKEFTLPTFFLNLISLLFSFNYGLFFYSPILFLNFLLILKIKSYLKKDRKKLILISLFVISLFIIFASFWWMWTGGVSLNARLIIEVIPLMIILLNYVLLKYWKNYFFRLIFIVFFFISFFINFLTTYMLDLSYYDRFPRCGHRCQNQVAWFNKPIFLTTLIEKKYIYVEQIKKEGENLYIIKKIYRPSLKYFGLPKIFENKEKLF